MWLMIDWNSWGGLMNKKLKDLTIEEIYEMCTTHTSCTNCPFEYMKHQDNVPERAREMSVCLRLIDIFHLNILDNEVKNNE